MPSKRTNDSVDRILADLNQRQAADGVRASVTDHQVDEILRSVGISTTPLQNTPTQDSQIAFSDFSGPDDFDEIMRSAGATSAPASMPAPAPRRTAETPRAAAPQRLCVEAGILGYHMYQNGQQFRGGDGIVSKGVENTIRNISMLGHDGMRETDKEIVKIMMQKP